jgi:hypothetical protein
MECTIGVISKEGKTFLLKNFDFQVVPVSWAEFRCIDGYDHFALVDHYQQGVNSGLNVKKLALIISSSDIGKDREEKRTILNAEILSKYDNVEDAVKKIKEYAEANPNMRGGNVILADSSQIAVVEYFEGRTEFEVIEEGYLARANHSIFGIVDNASENSKNRYESMISFLKNLFQDFPSEREMIEKCKKRLRSEPILNKNTRSSFVINVKEQRVDYKVEDRKWRVWKGKGEQR